MKYIIYSCIGIVAVITATIFLLNCTFIIENIFISDNGLTPEYVFCNIIYAAILIALYNFYSDISSTKE